MNLESLQNPSLYEGAHQFLAGQLELSIIKGRTGLPLPYDKLFPETEKIQLKPDTRKVVGQVYLLGSVDQQSLAKKTTDTLSIFSETPEEEIVVLAKQKEDYQGLNLFAIEIKTTENLPPSRTCLAEIIRALNRRSKGLPVIVLFRYNGMVSIGTSDRTPFVAPHKRLLGGEKVGKVSILKDVKLQGTHRGHIEILKELAQWKIQAKGLDKFKDLVTHWKKVFDTRELNKKFYNELFNWYLWALRHARFPQIRPTEDLIKDEQHQSESLIRLLTRILFVWFMKEKKLVSEDLFEPKSISKILKHFKPSNADAADYYPAILQNLFFATLNKPVNERKARSNKFRPGEYADPLLYRFGEKFSDEANYIKHFENIPFLNGGLFDCLDQKAEKDKGIPEIRLDGFTTSKDEAKKPHLPDFLFFGKYENEDLSEEYNDEKKNRQTIHGLIDILKNFKFTIEENTPLEEDVALDPELLGKVFENLLASYNEETSTTARKQTGSFYTPREIVDYMVDESLLAYLDTKLEAEDKDRRLRHLFDRNQAGHLFTEPEKLSLIHSINQCKILDPACGSGAFPMGVLQKLIFVLQKLDPENKIWLELVVKGFPAPMREQARKKLLEENWNYVRKLGIIQECIYGVDIQPIAIQIAKLRFFISLLVDQQEKPEKENRGFEALPNLDFKLVTANTLIGAPKNDVAATYTGDALTSFETLTVEYFNAHRPEEKAAKKKEIERCVNVLVDANQRIVNQFLKKISQEENTASTSRKKQLTVQKDQYESDLNLWKSYHNLFNYEAVGFFETRYFFPNVKEGFDVVIGNPPYVDIKALPPEDVTIYFNLFKTAENRINLYSLFIEKGVSLLRTNGLLVYINPNSILINESYKKIRRHIVDGVSKIIKLPDSVFEAATVETIILMTKSLNIENSVKGVYFKNNEIIDFGNLVFKDFSREAWSEDPDARFNVFTEDKFESILKKIESQSSALETLVFFSLGITPYDKYKGHSQDLIKNRKYHANYKIDKTYVPLISGKSIHPFFIVDEVDEYLKYGEWLGAARDPKFFEDTKIIVRQIVGGKELKIVAGYSEKPHYFTQIGFSLLSKTDDFEELLVLLGLLNSNLISFYHKHKFLDTEKIVFQKILIANCRKLPIKLPEDYSEITALVTQILNLKEANPKAETRDLEQQIDVLVYKLYGLSYEEVKVVEQGFDMSEAEYNKPKLA